MNDVILLMAVYKQNSNHLSLLVISIIAIRILECLRARPHWKKAKATFFFNVCHLFFDIFRFRLV